ncbi:MULTISPECIES: hypothetical protein [Streptomyces]|uniref:Uncharacterized protein n=2 Tax=Streptomyces TaxID=1883 RepID=A0ABU4K228_9ACTN|nr:hypothetical protein [Streptomyces roseolus]MDX2291815.1 hypothetical protein [Streptomyces roseolus]
MAELRSLTRAYNLAILVTSQVITEDPDDPDVPVTAAHLPAGMADYSDRVLVLDRPGAPGNWDATTYPSTAILRRVTGPGPAIELELEPEHCRFVSPGGRLPLTISSEPGRRNQDRYQQGGEDGTAHEGSRADFAE